MSEGLLAHFYVLHKIRGPVSTQRVILNSFWVGGCVGGANDLSEMLKKSLHSFPQKNIYVKFAYSLPVLLKSLGPIVPRQEQSLCVSLPLCMYVSEDKVSPIVGDEMEVLLNKITFVSCVLVFLNWKYVDKVV